MTLNVLSCWHKVTKKLRNLFAQKQKTQKIALFFDFFSSLRKKIAHLLHYLCIDSSNQDAYVPTQ